MYVTVIQETNMSVTVLQET